MTGNLGSTIVDVFWQNATRYGPRPALRRRASQGWEVLTWDAYAQAVRRLAAGLARLGVQPGDRVGLLSGNRREWHIADLASLAAGACTVPIYPTSSSRQVGYMLSHSGCRVVVVENGEQLAKVALRRDELDTLEHIVVMDVAAGFDHELVSSIEDLSTLGDTELAENPTLVEDRCADLKPDDLATLVYTSGTTGPPKGAMLTHGNLAANLDQITSVVPIGPEDRFLSFLPLSHIAERTVSHFGQIASGGETWFAQSLTSLPDDLTECRPTIFFAVPRVWEKFRAGIVERIEGSLPPQRVVGQRYLSLAARRGGVGGGGEPLNPVEEIQYRALDAVAGRTIRRTLGLDKTRYLVCAAAPVHPDLLRWFDGLGLPIAEVYGQTENCGVTTMNPPGAIRIGTVGPAVPGVELRIAEDGEILVRAPNVSPGYYENPTATEELLDPDGWMRTGDLGELDEAGYLRITGRKKDLIINAAGKNISPQEIETRLRYEPLISQAIVIGDARPYLTALLTLDEEAAREWAAHHGRRFGSAEEMLGDEALLAELQASVERVNGEHARVEGIKRWKLLPRDLSMATGELTPTLKVKRNVVAEQWSNLVEEMYQR